MSEEQKRLSPARLFLFLTVILLFAKTPIASELVSKDANVAISGIQPFQYDGELQFLNTVFDVGNENGQAGILFTPSVSYNSNDFLVFEIRGAEIQQDALTNTVLALPSATMSTPDNGLNDVFIKAHVDSNNQYLVFQTETGKTYQQGSTYEIRGLQLQAQELSVSVVSYGVRNGVTTTITHRDFDETPSTVIAVAMEDERSKLTQATINNNLDGYIPKISRQGYQYLGESLLFFRFIPTLKISSNDILSLTISGAEIGDLDFESTVYEAYFRGIDSVGGVPTDNNIPHAQTVNILNITENQLLLAPPVGYEIEAYAQVSFILSLKNISGPVTVSTATRKSFVDLDQSIPTIIAEFSDQLAFSMSQSFSRRTDFTQRSMVFAHDEKFSDNVTDTIRLSIRNQTDFSNISATTGQGWSSASPFHRVDIVADDFSFLMDENGQLDESKILLLGTLLANDPNALHSDKFVKFKGSALELQENRLSIYVENRNADFDISLRINEDLNGQSIVEQNFFIDVSAVGYIVDDSNTAVEEVLVPVFQHINAGNWLTNAVEFEVPYYQYISGAHHFMYLANGSADESTIEFSILDGSGSIYDTVELTNPIKPYSVQALDEDVWSAVMASGVDVNQPLYFKFSMDLPSSLSDLTIGTNLRGQRMLHKVSKRDNGL